MKKILINYGGTILLYLVIFVGITLVCTRLQNTNPNLSKSFEVSLTK